MANLFIIIIEIAVVELNYLMKKLNIRSRNINYSENSILKMNNMKKNSLYSTKEATPRKEHNKVFTTKKMMILFLE